jgi:hypothetical protein
MGSSKDLKQILRFEHGMKGGIPFRSVRAGRVFGYLLTFQYDTKDYGGE